MNISISKEPTDFIFLRAGVESGYSFCDFAIISNVKDLKEEIAKRSESLKAAKEADDRFFSGNYLDNRVDFFYNDFEDESEEKLINSLLDESPCYINIDEEDYENLPIVEEKMDLVKCKVYPDGSFFFTGSGKYSNDEYYTDDISFKNKNLC
jgi:hypothetical protein